MCGIGSDTTHVFQFHGLKKSWRIGVHTMYCDRGIWFVHFQNVFVLIKTFFSQITPKSQHQESRMKLRIINYLYEYQRNDATLRAPIPGQCP